MHFIELISRAQKGDIQAYGELVRRFQGMAFGYAYSLLRDFHLAQDATQEAFLEGWRHVGAIRDARAWPVWLRRVVFKHCDRLLRRKRVTWVPIEEAIPDISPLADERMERDEMKAHLAAALDILTKEERAIAILSAIHRYRHREIADFLEIPIDTVKNRLRTTRRKLSERILEMAADAIGQEMPSISEQFADIQALSKACKDGDLARVTNLLQKHPDVLDSPDRDVRFPYPESNLMHS